MTVKPIRHWFDMAVRLFHSGFILTRQRLKPLLYYLQPIVNSNCFPCAVVDKRSLSSQRLPLSPCSAHISCPHCGGAISTHDILSALRPNGFLRYFCVEQFTIGDRYLVSETEYNPKEVRVIECVPMDKKSAFAGNAGEFFVLAELTRREWTAALTARNNRAYDILAKRGDESAALRVKTKTSASAAFQWNAKGNGDIFLEMSEHKDFCILVDIPEEEHASPTYYIVPTHVIDKWLRDDFAAWVTSPGANGQQRAKDNKRRIFHADDQKGRVGHGYLRRLRQYKGAWHLLDAT